LKAAVPDGIRDPKINTWLERINIWSLRKANTRWGAFALLFCTFADASLLGLPAPVLFVTLILINTKKAGLYTIISVLGTLTGAVAGYSIGHFAWINSNGEFTGWHNIYSQGSPDFPKQGT
jgi:membrane protein YqaA with SNARE-associated domain